MSTGINETNVEVNRIICRLRFTEISEERMAALHSRGWVVAVDAALCPTCLCKNETTPRGQTRVLYLFPLPHMDTMPGSVTWAHTAEGLQGAFGFCSSPEDGETALAALIAAEAESMAQGADHAR